MCFRPAGIDIPELRCPECGKKLDTSSTPNKCPFCKEDLTEYAEEFKKKLAAMPGTSGAPGSPKAPGAPMAPSA